MNPKTQLPNLCALQHSPVRQDCCLQQCRTHYPGRTLVHLASSQSLEAPLRYLVFHQDIYSGFHVANAPAAAMGGTYAFVSTASANLRQKNDPYNPGLGGFFAGALVGLRSTSKMGKGRLWCSVADLVE